VEKLLDASEPKRVEEHQRAQGETAVPERRAGIERRHTDRRVAAHALNAGDTERRVAERRVGQRRVSDNVPPLICPDCLGPLQYDPALSWSMPGAYTVDTGYCPSCSRRFLRNRETGDYDTLSL
jgi:hypothetical protein